MEETILVALLVGVLPDVGVLGAVPEHAIDQPGQFVSGRRDGFGCTEPCSEPPVVRPQCRPAVMEALRGKPQGICGSVRARLRAPAQPFSAGDFIAGAQPHPRGKVLFGRPSTHLHPDLRQYGQGRVRCDAVDARQIDPCSPVQQGSCVKGRCTDVRGGFALRLGSLLALRPVVQGSQVFLDPGVAGGDLLRICV